MSQITSWSLLKLQRPLSSRNQVQKGTTLGPKHLFLKNDENENCQQLHFRCLYDDNDERIEGEIKLRCML